ncbi:MAG TPA: right-handed parallel beta-helix repeat-containing protein, partial [Candidatus Bathyarchaeia archaeon]|nr:right-handed parallel beta-helix repeat-containing protein [Candidatus Bathyarchaeia archaeon]
TEYRLNTPAGVDRAKVRIYKRNLEDLDFGGYNPFDMPSIMQNRVYLMPKPEELWRHLVRRGMVFVDGRRLEQVELYQGLAASDGAFWCEHNGLAIHVRLPGDADPSAHEVELAIQEQVFAPRTLGLGYIRIKGLAFEHGAGNFPVPQRGMVSMSRGHHWIIEDCALREANGVALDIGAQDWDMIPPPVIGQAIIRRNHIEAAGVCGIAGAGVQGTLIESNLIERVGDRNVELAWETGGIKLHFAKSCLIRSNVIRHTIHAEAIWIDYENANNRITGNVFGDNLETFRGGIYLEASHEPNMLDHNIIWKATESAGGGSYNMPGHGGWGITVDGSDDTVVAHNLVGLTQDAAVKFRNIESRIVSGRGGTARGNKVLGNIFYRCGKAIDFSNQDNTADYKLYTKDWGKVGDETKGVGRGLNWIPDAGTTLQLDLPAWQRFFGLDKNGAYAEMTIDVDLDALTMTWSVAGPLPQLPAGKPFALDILGQASPGGFRSPGPLAVVPRVLTTVSIDPRR